MKKIQGVFKSIAAVLSAPIFSATVYASRKCHNVRFHDLSVRLLLCKVIYPKYSALLIFTGKLQVDYRYFTYNRYSSIDIMGTNYH